MEDKRPVRVLFLSRAYVSTSEMARTYAGGMERLSFEFITALQNHPNIAATVIAHHGTRLALPFILLGQFFRALSVARQVDVIHLGDPVLAKLGWLLQRLTGTPIAVTVHGLDVRYPSALYRLYLHLFFRHFALYLPISQYAAQLLKRWQVTGTVRVINPGVTDRLYDPSRTRADLERVLNRSVSGKKVLLTVGRLVHRKGHAWFVKNVLPKLPDNVLYVVAGDGPQRPQIEAAAQASGMKRRIIFLGRVSEDHLQTLYNTVDAFVQPNIPDPHDAEGFGLVMVEAALCERPVFAANLDGIPDAIHDGNNGRLLPAGDAQSWIGALAGAASTPQSGTAAREYSLKTFNWQRQRNTYITALRDAALT